MNPKIVEMVNEKIIAQLEKGEIPWRKPWNGIDARPVSRATGKPYRGINRFTLDPGEYLAFRQVKELGGSVNKGEHGHIVVFWKLVDVQHNDQADNQEESRKKIPYLRYYTVFEVSQCTGIERKFAPIPKEEGEIIESAENVLNAWTQCRIDYKPGDRASYSPLFDRITLPMRAQFHSPEEFYGTAWHEMAHATGHSSRLKREHGAEAYHFGSPEYAREELIAELGSACVCQSIGLDNSTLTNTAAYCQSWLRALENDKNLILASMGKAEKAAEYILTNGGQAVEIEDREEEEVN